jgi:hypothetical protein
VAGLRFGRWQQEGGTVLVRIFVAALFTLVPSIAFGQCSGNFPANTLCGTATGGVPRAIAAPLSVANTDSSLTISPTTGSVIASLNVAHANSFSATQTFSNVIDTNLVSGGTQCVQATAAGLLVGTGAVCGSGGGGGGVTSVNNSDGTIAVVSPTGPAVTVSLALNHANTWTADQTFPHVLFTASAGNGINDQSAVSSSIGTFWTSSGPAIVHRMNRLLIGPAAQNGTGSPSLPNSWMNSIVGGGSDLANIVVDASLFDGIQAGGRTSVTCASGIGCPSGGSAGAYLFGYNDDNTAGNIALGSNSVGFAKSGTAGIVLGAQQDIDCATTAYVSTPASPDNPSGGTCIAALLTAGAFTFATTNASAALVISSGATKVFGKGIVVGFNALDTAQGQGGKGVAMEVYPGHTLRWYDGTTVYAEMGSVSAGGVFNMFTQGASAQWKINGATTVSCASGTVNGATVVVVNGIITHC